VGFIYQHLVYIMASSMRSVPQEVIASSTDTNSNSSEEATFPKLEDRLTEELVFAFVGPIGSGCTTSNNVLKELLDIDYGYQVFPLSLSSYIPLSAHLVGEKKELALTADKRIENLQLVGDKLRENFGSSYLAEKAIEEIAKQRQKDGVQQSRSGKSVPIKKRRAYIIDSIKHPDEFSKLRRTYGDIFWLVGVFAPDEKRKERLELLPEHDAGATDRIMKRDYRENEEHGQKVRDVFHQADFFIRNDQDNHEALTVDISRYLEILFGIPVHTPTIDESSMYAAHAEAAKSACMSRQVGAAIVNSKGDLIGLGRNDVPNFGGGLYAEDHGINDNRCFKWQGKICHNDQRKNDLYRQIHTELKEANLLVNSTTADAVIDAIKKTPARDLIEYSRAVHAEMDAITAVARNNKPGVLGGTIFVTTFPCHSCARHIIASGISKVIFIEPYPKSLAKQLHSDAISENERDGDSKLVFLQYSGIAPKNILKLFTGSSTRKTDAGNIQRVNKKLSAPIVVVSLDDYTTHEMLVVAELEKNEKNAEGSKQSNLPGV
jgi:deoxycytidylate deaminase